MLTKRQWAKLKKAIAALEDLSECLGDVDPAESEQMYLLQSWASSFAQDLEEQGRSLTDQA